MIIFTNQYKNKMKYFFIIYLVIISLLFSCNHNHLDIDISDINLEPLKVMRLDEDLFSINYENFDLKSKYLDEKYGQFYNRFLINSIHLNGIKDSLYKPQVLSFVNDKDINEANKYIKKIYSDAYFDELTQNTTECVKRFKYHFPKKPTPKNIITCVTGWNYSMAYSDNSLIIGLDMYLGDTAKFYRMLNLPKYQTKNFTKDHILPDMMRAWLLTEFDNSEPINTLINHTIFYGKLYYALNALLPNTADSLIFSYSEKQIKYCTKYEKQLWGYFAEKNRLYENDLKILRELTSDGPFTGAISKDCPPRIAMWVGWQIVKSYMKNNKLVTLSDLMNETDAQKILSKSKYRP